MDVRRSWWSPRRASSIYAATDLWRAAGLAQLLLMTAPNPHEWRSRCGDEKIIEEVPECPCQLRAATSSGGPVSPETCYALPVR
jgi:hypothetical protein